MASTDWNKSTPPAPKGDEKKPGADETKAHTRGLASRRAAVDARSFYVGNIAYHVSVEMVKEHFKQAGEVSYVHLPPSKTRMNGAERPNNRGYCFVEMKRCRK
jgi:RNA recognition motif-containing protein